MVVDVLAVGGAARHKDRLLARFQRRHRGATAGVRYDDVRLLDRLLQLARGKLTPTLDPQV